MSADRETRRQSRSAVALATAHLLFWFWLALHFVRQGPVSHLKYAAAGLGTMIAAWIQYRTVLALRRFEKQREGLPPARH